MFATGPMMSLGPKSKMIRYITLVISVIDVFRLRDMTHSLKQHDIAMNEFVEVVQT